MQIKWEDDGGGKLMANKSVRHLVETRPGNVREFYACSFAFWGQEREAAFRNGTAPAETAVRCEKAHPASRPDRSRRSQSAGMGPTRCF